MGKKPTAEQQEAVDAYRRGENLVLTAAAGTGKTTTLQLMAESTMGRKGLYVAFNKSVASDATRRFNGTGVIAKTAHSLAYNEFGRPLNSRLQKKTIPFRERAVMLGIKGKIGVGEQYNITTIPPHTQVRMAAETVAAFCRTAGTEITPDLVTIPPALTLDVVGDAEVELRNVIVDLAKKYWQDLLNPQGLLPAQHDNYLKMWALSNPQLDTDVIYWDEAQDADPVMTGVIANQKNTQVVAVGDRSQAIYGWRGAINSMDEFGGVHYKLTQSFRFGQAIADEANAWLGLLGADIRVRGLEGKPSSVFPSKKREPEAVLTRTNAGAINEVMECHLRGVSVAIGGERKAQQLRSLAQAAYDLQTKHWTTHPEFDLFKEWSDVQAYVEEDETSELAPLVKLVDEYSAKALVSAIDACVPEDEARTVVSTVHVAKGGEWLHVRIAEDFREPGRDDEGEPELLEREEAMTAYVAVTRAQRHLDNTGLAWVHQYTGSVKG